MKKQDSQQRVGVGISSVLMILVVLAMTALSLLAFGSARTNQSMTQRNTDIAANYYVAADQAQRTLAQVDAVLMAGQAAGADLGWYQSQGLPEVSWSDTGQGVQFSFTADAGQGLAVYVCGLVTDGPQRYQIIEHRTVDTRDWQESNHFMLMGE